MKIIISIAILINVSAVFSLLPVKQKCNVWDHTCTTASGHSLMPHILKGAPEKGLGPLNKVNVSSIILNKEGLNVELKNLQIQISEDFSDFIVKKVKLEKNLKLLRIVFQIPYIIYTANYNVSGQIFDLPVYGAGDMLIKTSDAEIDMTLSFNEKLGDDGKLYFDYTSYIYWYDASNVVLQFNNLYNGDKIKSDATHLFLQRNWNLLSAKYGRILLDNYIDAMFKVFNALSSLHPIDYFVTGY